MTEARCPLVREIEETAASWHGPGTYPTAAQVDAYFIVEDNVFYARLRAALEAAEEMAQHAEAMEAAVGCPPAVADWLKRYRAATRDK